VPENTDLSEELVIHTLHCAHLLFKSSSRTECAGDDAHWLAETLAAKSPFAPPRRWGAAGGHTINVDSTNQRWCGTYVRAEGPTVR
jgi:hypothetical protein